MSDLPTRVLLLARSLPEAQRAAVDLCYGLSGVDTYRPMEAARMLKLSRANVIASVRRGLHLVWLALGDETVEPETLHDLLIASRMRERAGLAPPPEGG